MHSHETCEQLMAAANRTGHYGRLEYLTARCDRMHGTTPASPAADELRDNEASTTTEDA